jgi:hypothetical protein
MMTNQTCSKRCEWRGVAAAFMQERNLKNVNDDDDT